MRANPGVGRLLAAEVVSPLCDAIGILAQILNVQQTRDTATAVGVLLLADAVAPPLSLLAGTLADRVHQRHVMVVTAIGQAAAVPALSALLPPCRSSFSSCSCAAC